MAFGNTGQDDRALYTRATEGEDIMALLYPNAVTLGLQNLDSKANREIFARAVQGEDIMALLYPNGLPIAL